MRLGYGPASISVDLDGEGAVPKHDLIAAVRLQISQ